MPFQSKAQQRFMFATKPRLARKWAREMKDNHQSIKTLPEKKKLAGRGIMEPCAQFEVFFAEAMEKIAKAKKKGRQVPLGFKDTFLATTRVLRSGDKGVKKLVVSKGGVKRRLRAHGKGFLIGAPPGALLGAGAYGLLKRGPARGSHAAVAAMLGGLLGGSVGGDVSQARSDMKFLRGKGIDMRWHGLSSKATPAAYKKYIKAYKKK